MDAFRARRRDPGAAGAAVWLALAMPREAVTVAWVRTLTGDVLRRLGVASSCIDDVQLVLSEACGNAVTYGQGDEDYEVQLAIDGSSCLLEVRNWGPPPDPEALSHGMPPPDALGGRGIAMMRYLTDELTFRSDAEVTTVSVRMTMVHQMEAEEGRVGPPSIRCPQVSKPPKPPR
jgi:serine/threonine-protein kinase RsbW